MRRGRSLRWRLLAGVLSAVGMVWIAMAASAYLQARHELDELLDAHLAQAAAVLLAHLSEEAEEADEIELDHAPRFHPYARRVAFQIWEQGRWLRLHSVSAPAERLSPADRGFSDGVAGGRRWRVFSTWGAGRRFLIQVAERTAARDELSRQIAAHLLLPPLIALPLLGIALTLAIRRALRPLAEVAGQVAARDPRHLEPIAVGTVPEEIGPLVERLNGLFRRMEETLEHERRFTADASHELRTPIAAIRAQAQVAREAADAAERCRALDRVILGCDRATHLVTQLLTLARLDAGRWQPTAQSCDLVGIAHAVLAELGPWAHARGISLELEAGASVPVLGDEALLRALVRNLVDNAVRYSPAGGVVTVRVRSEPAGALLEVIDRGPGIPPAERERVLGRFHRLARDEEGSGLGLSIVLRVAELCGAELALRDAEGHAGLRVTVRFPPSALPQDA